MKSLTMQAIKALRLARKIIAHQHSESLRGSQSRAYYSAALENLDETIDMIRSAGGR